jgi:hypothetical protein
MLIGLVKWFDAERKFGIIVTPDDGEIFLYSKNFRNAPIDLPPATPIIFNKEFNDKRNRNEAGKCHIVGEPKDWNIILEYLCKPDILSFETQVTITTRLGRTHQSKLVKSFSILELGSEHLFKDKSEDELLNIITDYFDKSLDKKDFIQYCEFVEKSVNKIDTCKNSNLLKKIYSHFGSKLDETTLFYIWKNKKLKFIAHNDVQDYELPEVVLRSFENEIDIPELRRIIWYKYGSAFCNEYVNAKFDQINDMSMNQLVDLYPFLKLISGPENNTLRSQLDKIYSENVISRITKNADQYGRISNDDDFNKYNILKQLIPNEISYILKEKIDEALNQFIVSMSSDNFLPELWLKVFVPEPSFELISNLFLKSDTQSEKRVTILSKLQVDQQLDLLKMFAANNNWEEAFNQLENFIKNENSLGLNFKLNGTLFDKEFWKGKKGSELVNLFSDYANINTTDLDKFDLFFKGLIQNIPQDVIRVKIAGLSKDECEKIFINQISNSDLLIEVLLGKISASTIGDIGWIYDLGKKYLDTNGFIKLDQAFFNTIHPTEYFIYWLQGKGKILPKLQIDERLKDNYESYSEIEKWINKGVISQIEVIDYLFSNLQTQVPVTSRIIFYTQFNHIKYLIHLDDLHTERINGMKNDFYNIILWFLDSSIAFDFDLLKFKFIYFNPDDQVKIIRKLFYLKAKGEFELSVEKLNELSRVDLDLYKTNFNINPDINLDISTDVIIKALSSFNERQRFFVESELLQVVLKDIKNDKTKRFRLANYFENCTGRLAAKYNWASSGEIEKIKFGDNQFYFAITFLHGKNMTVHGYYGDKVQFVRNSNYNHLREEVKTIHGSRWNDVKDHWGVPSQRENEVLQFAKSNHFFLNFEGSKYANNAHLADFVRTEVPSRISFCEGRLANKLDNIFKKEFWWCANQPCFQKCETLHTAEQWESYTLLDFCEILGFNTDETNRIEEVISKGIYYQFIGLVNRFNVLLEKLYCHECNEILQPFETANYAANSVVRFCCENSNCGQNKKVVYLNHCLNAQCNNIIDSRVSKTCSNGLYICDTCGSCCSHNMFQRRLANLQTTGGAIYPQLTYNVQEKMGHLERGEYYCHKCGKVMTETNHEIFQCEMCNVIYDTTKYNIKRPNKQIPKTIILNTNIIDNEEFVA